MNTPWPTLSSIPPASSSGLPTETTTDTTGKVLKGNCHCGRNRFEYSPPHNQTLEDVAVKCSCTLCSKKGYIWLPFPSTPSEGELKWTRNDGVTKYWTPFVWDKFCSNCGTGLVGVHLYGPLKGYALVNVRAIQGANTFFLDSVIKTVHLEEEGPFEPLALSPDVLYNGSCHCGNVQFQLKKHGQELEKPWPVKEDNCSSCVRDAFVGIYPSKEFVFIPEESYNKAFEYRYNKGRNAIHHCSSCGVMVFMVIHGPPNLAEILEKLKKENPERYRVAKGMAELNLSLQPLNVRTLEGIDWECIRQRVERTDEGTEGYVTAG
ncbi:hypothetical protein B0T09DRAFT_406665 [Sordaria sp. MPI-SDFR-AT-0083]|nr:hypothetical protein B0T09DRAFT_406665 [Sordaria sp. MPI-SDFR-AT-0083]